MPKPYRETCANFQKTRGFDAKVAALDDITLPDLADMKYLLIIAATVGEGEPTDNAAKFYSALMADNAPSLPATLNYSVCGLGDSSYADFNQAARDIDTRLAELGATRAADLVACDGYFEEDYATWKETAFARASFSAAAGAAAAPEP